MIAMMAQQQFSNQSGMSPEQVYAIMNPQKASGLDPNVGQAIFGYMGDYGGQGKGGINEYVANQLSQDFGPSAGWAAYQNWLQNR